MVINGIIINGNHNTDKWLNYSINLIEIKFTENHAYVAHIRMVLYKRNKQILCGSCGNLGFRWQSLRSSVEFEHCAQWTSDIKLSNLLWYSCHCQPNYSKEWHSSEYYSANGHSIINTIDIYTSLQRCKLW